MGRKRRSPRPPVLASLPEEDDFHRPFREVKEILRKAAAPPASRPAPSTPSYVPTRKGNGPPSHPADIPPEQRIRREKDTFFLSQMADVIPLPKDPRGYAGKPRPRGKPDVRERTDPLSELREFIEGRGPFSIQCTDEYVEGVAPGVDLRLAQRLHRGDFAIQAQCDLHGHTVDEAKAAVQRFVAQAHASGQRCVRVIHGRGRNSRDNRPVLKEQVQLWLSHGRLSRLVLAFATAPATDGGAGAVYVLLRRSLGQRGPSD